jgi:hypothetical protein
MSEPRQNPVKQQEMRQALKEQRNHTSQSRGDRMIGLNNTAFADRKYSVRLAAGIKVSGRTWTGETL